MKHADRWSGVTVGALILIGAACACAQDWPQWRGPQRDGKVNGFTAPQAWPKELTQKWKVTVGSGDATPALVDEKLYVFARQGDEEVTLCLSTVDGKELWRNKYAAQAVSGPAGRHLRAEKRSHRPSDSWSCRFSARVAMGHESQPERWS